MQPSLAGRLVISAAVCAALSACGGGSSEPTQVLGEQITQETPTAPASGAETPASSAGTPAPVAEPAPPPPATPEAPAAPEPTAPASADPAAADGLTLDLTLESGEVAQGSDVRGVLTATNSTAAAIDLTHPTQCDTVQGLYAGGAQVSEARVCATAVKPDQIGPGETRTWAIRIPTGQVPPGSYDAVAGLDLTTGDRTAPAVPVTIRPRS